MCRRIFSWTIYFELYLTVAELGVIYLLLLSYMHIYTSYSVIKVRDNFRLKLVILFL